MKMRLYSFSWILLAALAAGQGGFRTKAGTMTTAELDQLFRTKNPQVVEAARQAGPPIVSSIEPHLHNADYVIRLLAVNSIAAAGGPQASLLLIRALGDSNEQVRDNAVNSLHERLPNGQQAALLAAWDANRTRDGYVRQQIPMVLGRMHQQSGIAELRARLPRDDRQEVKDGIIAGMAKLGDAGARTTLGEMLRDARGTRTAELIQFVTYEDEPWVIPLLVPVLQRRDIALRLSTHVVDILRRECDLAADEVIRVSKAQFSFGVDPMAQYTDAQINEVLRFAQAQPR
jgi:HEAT repeat protein